MVGVRRHDILSVLSDAETNHVLLRARAAGLLILKRLIRTINPTDPPKPCDCFDMIGGTITGG
jgi:hypothetical protein